MAKDKLMVIEDTRCQGYRIQWYLAQEEDMGAVLGESDETKEPNKTTHLGDWEHWKATVIAKQSVQNKEAEMDSWGLYWDSYEAANRTLRAINAALKSSVPLPDWAEQAIAAGWKAPKGWKP